MLRAGPLRGLLSGVPVVTPDREGLGSALADLVNAAEAVGEFRRYWPRDMRHDGTDRKLEAALDEAKAALAACQGSAKLAGNSATDREGLRERIATALAPVLTARWIEFDSTGNRASLRNGITDAAADAVLAALVEDPPAPEPPAQDDDRPYSLLRRSNLGPSPCGDPTCQCPDPCDSMDCRCPE